MNARPPVVAILGHVDHGKTTLLDYLRKSRIAAKEHGGITQRIGGYEVETGIKGYETSRITFIDTPGHEAFSQLRTRGAQVADIAILVIDAKDSLMPQTVESIFHIKNANIPFVVALNKTDLPDAKPQKVHNDLLKHEVITENKGGTVPAVEISAKTGKGIPELLESLLLVAADKHLTYDPKSSPVAYIIETKKDKRGVVASCIIKNGLLRIGDEVFAEDKKAKVKALINDLGEHMQRVMPSTPFELLGFTEMPVVGSSIGVTEQKSTAASTLPESFRDINTMFDTKEVEKKLAVVIKADSQGTLEAITAALGKNENIAIKLSAVGDVHRSDIFLAKTTKAVVVGFGAHVDPIVSELAKQEKVIIKTYNIIYELLDELQEVSQLLMEKEQEEKSAKGEAKILANFIIEGEKIVGISMSKGKANLGDTVEIYRGGTQVNKTSLVSLKIRAKTVEEVRKGQEAGMVFSPQLDLRVGDVIKFIL